MLSTPTDGSAQAVPSQLAVVQPSAQTGNLSFAIPQSGMVMTGGSHSAPGIQALGNQVATFPPWAILLLVGLVGVGGYVAFKYIKHKV